MPPGIAANAMLEPTYNLLLVAASVLLAVLCGYVAFGITRRMAASRGGLRAGWLVTGALVLGWGVWAMHFVGMLAWHVDMAIGYAPGLTALSLVPAVLGAGLALVLAAGGPLRGLRLWLAGCSLGVGVGAMHYTGMAAMRMDPVLVWNRPLVALSIAYAVLGATLTLWVSMRLWRQRGRRHQRTQWLAAGLLGGTVAGMHYLAMAAAQVRVGSVCTSAGSPLHGMPLAVVILIISAVLLGGTLLASSLHARLARQRRQAERALCVARQQLALRQYQDELTGLPNRVMLMRHLQTQLQRTRASDQHFALILLRIDGIERLQQALGAAAGDAALRALVVQLQRCLDQRGMLARISESSFAVCSDAVRNADSVARLTHELLRRVREPTEVLGLRASLGARAGAVLAPADGNEPELLLQHALAALRSAAESAADFVFYQREHQRGVHQRIALAAELREAIACGQVQAHYQMIWDVQARCPRGAEALARWQHPLRGWVAPAEFVSLAEAEGLAVELDWAMLVTVLRQLRAWDAENVTAGAIAVNLSAPTLVRADFIPRLEALCAEYGLVPGRLRFELTESSAMGAAPQVREHMAQLRARGCSVLLDDFGTGYSSLAQLRHLPLTALKIDQSFVRGAEHNRADREIVEAIVTLARSLRLGAVVEGVETAWQVDWLTGLGVEALQGYFYAHPEPAARYAALLAEHSAARVRAAPLVRAVS